MKKKIFVMLLLLIPVLIIAAEDNSVIIHKLPSYSGTVLDSADLSFIKSDHNIGNIGEPAIPWFYGVFLVPEDADFSNVLLSVIKKSVNKIKLNNTLSNVKSIEFIGANKPAVNVDRTQYDNLSQFPIVDAEILGFSDLYGNRIMRVRIPMAIWNKSDNTITTLTEGELKITLNGKKVITGNECPFSVLKRLKSAVLNFPEGLLERRSRNRADEKYVIMTTSTIQNNLNNLDAFVQSKEAKGYIVEVVTNWGSTASQLRDWLSSRYQSENIAYALMIGNGAPNVGDVPMYGYWEQTLGDYIPTDFYYAQLSSAFTTSDLDAEIAVGRIPMYNNNYSTTDMILQRMINYENAKSSEIEWRKNALFAGVYLDNQTSGSGIFEIIRNSILSPNGWDCYRIYADGVGYPDEIGCSYSKFSSAWNSGTYGLVEWSTHGLKDDADDITYSSATSSFSDENPPIVFSASCQNAWVEVSNNLAYSLLKNAAVSVVAPTRNSMYLPGQNAQIANLGTNQGYTIELARGLVEDSMGVANALNAVKSWATVQSSQLWTNFCDYNVYGCPEIGVYSQGSGVDVIKSKTFKNASVIKHVNNHIEFIVDKNLRAKVELFNVQGKMIYSASKTAKVGLNRIALSDNIAAGTYFGTIKLDNKKSNFSFIKN